MINEGFETIHQSAELARFDAFCGIANIILSLYFCKRFKKLQFAMNQRQQKAFAQSIVWSILHMILSIVTSLCTIALHMNVLIFQPTFFVTSLNCDAISCLFCTICAKIFLVSWIMRACCFVLVMLQTVEDHFKLSKPSHDTTIFTIVKVILVFGEGTVAITAAIFFQSKLYVLHDSSYISCYESPNPIDPILRPLNGVATVVVFFILLGLIFKKESQV